MSVSEVARITGVTTADVIRVATQGGSTQDDWAIAHAIQTVTGRNAYELMFTAGRAADISQIWADSRANTEPVAPTNPNAVYDPTVTIYGENTSPDETRQIAPHHPGDHDEPVDEIDDQDQDETDPGRTAWNNMLHTHVWADVAALTSSTPDEIARTVRPWSTARDAITGMTTLIARRTARTPNTNTIAAALTA